MQIFSTSDNHDELGSNLESLKLLGMNPYLAFSDDPSRDESLLKKHFSNLCNGHDNNIDVENDKPTNLSEMTCDKKILYLYDLDKTLTALSKFREDIDNALRNPSQSIVKIAFDTGNPIYFYITFTLCKV